MTTTSPSNPKIKLARSLRQRKARQETGLFLIEGIRHVGEALAAGAAFEFLCYAPDRLRGDFAASLLADAAARGIPCLALTEGVFASLADKEHPQGILAVARSRWAALHTLAPENFPWGVALVAPQDPGNIGAILRTIDAVGASGLLLLDDSADPYHPSAVRASMGAIFWLPLVRASFADFAAWAGAQRYTVVGTSARGRLPYETPAAYPSPLILLLGSEREGLSSEQMAICNQVVRLPMNGRVTSLNLAVAAGVFLYDMLQRRSAK